MTVVYWIGSVYTILYYMINIHKHGPPADRVMRAMCGRVSKVSVERLSRSGNCMAGVEKKNRLAFSVTTTTTSTIANFSKVLLKNVNKCQKVNRLCCSLSQITPSRQLPPTFRKPHYPSNPFGLYTVRYSQRII